MKKLLALILALAMAFSLVACGDSKEPAADSGTSKDPVAANSDEGTADPEFAYKVGISMTSQMQQRWAKEGELLKTLCEEKGYEAVLTWANDDSVRQAADIENLVSQGCDVIIVCPVDQDALDAALESAKEAGAFVIDYDRLIRGTEHVDYTLVSADLNDMPPVWANFFIDRFDLDADDGKTYTIEFFGGSPTESAAILWMDETVKLLQPYLDSGKLVCPSGQTTYEACGIANMKLMFEGYIAHNIFKNTTKLANLTVEAVEKHYNGEELVVTTTTNNGVIDIPTQVLELNEVTPDNWYDVLVKEAGYYTLEDLGLTEADIPQ